MLHKCQVTGLKTPLFPRLFRPRPRRCGSSPSWTSLTPWASLTARPTCRPSLLPEETSTPLLRDCWAHSPLKRHTVQPDTQTHAYIHVRLVNTLTHSKRTKRDPSVSFQTLQKNSGQSSAEPEFFLCSQIIFLISILSFFFPPSSSKQISVLECCCRAGINHPHFAASVLAQRKGVRIPGCVFKLRFLHITVVCVKHA